MYKVGFGSFEREFKEWDELTEEERTSLEASIIKPYFMSEVYGVMYLEDYLWSQNIETDNGFWYYHHPRLLSESDRTITLERVDWVKEGF